MARNTLDSRDGPPQANANACGTGIGRLVSLHNFRPFKSILITKVGSARVGSLSVGWLVGLSTKK